ncbi:TetR family transcriptional regulator [Lentibacillus sediminis]|uniref:TetR family transcriptional regulator n=1 Tax=Lentibacillus sediminis TaxID=1940529 RepID=UPI000C1C231A|nr:TetR family transcriptional regulator [Lentibacillus sediminis]
MPKTTFYNLHQEKRDTLIEAAEKEFCRVPVFEASISNIVKEAGVPRGSFYQYFENKEDAFFYLLKEQGKKRQELFVSLLKKHHGDIFDALNEMYEQMLKEMSQGENMKLIRNALLHVTHEIEDVFTEMFAADRKKDKFREIAALIDQDKLNLKEDHDLFHIMQIVTAVAFRNLVEKFAKDLPDEEAMDNFVREMNLLKNGLYK